VGVRTPPSPREYKDSGPLKPIGKPRGVQKRELIHTLLYGVNNG